MKSDQNSIAISVLKRKWKRATTANLFISLKTNGKRENNNQNYFVAETKEIYKNILPH